MASRRQNTHTVRRTALRHAAKVAFGPLVVGCGGMIATEDASTDAASWDVGADALDAVAEDSALACIGPVGDASVSEQVYQCCLVVIATDAGFTNDAGDPSVENCCEAIVSRIFADPDSGDMFPYRCCSILPTTPGFCVGWGPPMPPAMVA
jgi:hypothetical protein